MISAPATLANNATDLISSGPIAAQILVEAPATTVNISNLVVDASGSGWDGYSTNLVGIYYQNASGLVDHVVTRNQESVPPTGSSVGFGIFAEATTTASTVTVESSSVHDFGKNGIVARGNHATLIASVNQVRGNLPAAGDAENGIEFAYGATGSATSNEVSDLVYAPCDSQTDNSCDSGSASGILVYDGPGVTITSNRVSNTQDGIAVDGVSTGADSATITSNVVDGSLVYDGIDVCGSSHGTISGNRVAGSAQAGIHLDGSCPLPSGGITVSGNLINEACAAYLENTTSPNTVSFAAATTTTVVNTLVTGTDQCLPSQQSEEAFFGLSAHPRVVP